MHVGYDFFHEIQLCPDSSIVQNIHVRITTPLSALSNVADLVVHPLTRLSAIRKTLGADIEDEQSLDRYIFVLRDGKSLNENATLWDLGISSGSEIRLCMFLFLNLVQDETPNHE